MKTNLINAIFLTISYLNCLHAQEQDKSAIISVFTGFMNYHGDLNPHSFKYSHSQFSVGIGIRKPLDRLFSIRAGVHIGTITAADRWNRDYLKTRNLSFTSRVTEAHGSLELTVLDFAEKRFSPFIYGGVAIFRFNPWTRDKDGIKTYLKPLSTEGQGLPQYPTQKPYSLTQIALPFGCGLRFAVSDDLYIAIEVNQRKTFTDYLDDVSTHYVDREVLLREKGIKAVQLSFREYELPNGRQNFPAYGEQRGTPTEMDWYYFWGLNMEAKLTSLTGLFKNKKTLASQRCPKRF